MLLTAIIFIIVLGLLVFVHELGHFLTARMFGIKAEEFGFGFPPRICGWTKKKGKRRFFWGNEEVEKLESEDTVLSLNWLPIGGFVKIKGEDGADKSNDSLLSKKPWKRVIVMSAGVLMNFVLATILISWAFMLGAPQVVDGDSGGAEVSNTQLQVLQVVEGSAGAEAGLLTGDVIKTLDNQAVDSVEEVKLAVREKSGQPIVAQINRYGQDMELTIIPGEQDGVGYIGASFIRSGIVKYPWYEAIWLGIKSTVLLTGQIVVAFGVLIKGLFVGLPPGVDVAGPVGIAIMTGQIARLGFVYLLQFAALLSINLAIINFIPFPALDGGRVLFIIIEKIKGSPVNRKVEQIIHTVGFFFLIFLVIVVTGRDIVKFREVFFNLFHRIVG